MSYEQLIIQLCLDLYYLIFMQYRPCPLPTLASIAGYMNYINKHASPCVLLQTDIASANCDQIQGFIPRNLVSVLILIVCKILNNT